MKWHKISALMQRDYLVVKRSKWRLIEIFYFPITTIIIWGIFALYSAQFAAEAGLIILAVNVFWAFSIQSQQHVNLQMNEDVWSGSLKQILSSGISEFEYLVARVITSISISFLIVSILLALSLLFGLSFILTNTVETLIILVGVFIASIGLSILTAGLITFFGREYTFLAWTVLQMFILFSAPFFPVEMLGPLQPIAWIMPYTRMFAAIRDLVTLGSTNFYMLYESLGIAIVYIFAALPFYKYAFKRARRTGKLIEMG
ncbi:MAG: ABC transporter permease [Candidatus Aenigmarchaeota archaeon]|nr:ABC transporter permease [Candidatus Aenigmarchaeota archaeon]